MQRSYSDAGWSEIEHLQENAVESAWKAVVGSVVEAGEVDDELLLFVVEEVKELVLEDGPTEAGAVVLVRSLPLGAPLAKGLLAAGLVAVEVVDRAVNLICA